MEKPFAKGDIMDFTPLKNVLDEITAWRIPGADIAVIKDNEVVFRYQAGYSDLENKKPLSALVNGICIAFGFAITAFILGAAREILGSGSLFGFKVVKPVFPAAKLPFWGFIFLGFMAALVNFIKEFIKKPTGEEETE